ncbi:MAG TPA: hypothetical protein DCS13_00980 [Candidatus Margulisbacteria bacterium]|nr:MAG: hypothetical protein A2X43_06120 [Candidatus Margulisbacteria bacterium GWD2_39_127]OGI01399.1 MAG: hypothetical protein A2X42_12945 [Candidatus Margulisbacteria bacterium GWF2_38_17]HAR62018.1 hypothetical protein [Candidatus Margulisiibacteriota bacterium]
MNNKKILLLSLGILCLGLIGCGQLTDQHTERVSALGDQISNQNGNNSNTNNSDNEEVLATNKITLTIGDPKASLSPQSITTKCLIASQSVNIVADVPSFLTFQACSDIYFNVTQLGKIEADGSIKLKIIYNDLLSKDIESIKVKACMLDANGLIGQKEPQSIIPLEVKVVDEKPYQDLNTNCAELKNWNAPFTQGINKVLTLKLKGDFTHALKQQYKGTILLKLVKEKKPECAVKWTKAEKAWPFANLTFEHSFGFVFKNKVWLVDDIEGFDLAFQYSNDGKVWNSGPQLDNGGDYQEKIRTAELNNKLWLVNIGSTLTDDPTDPEYYFHIRYSCDGLNWSKTFTPTLNVTPQAQFTAFNNKLWVFDKGAALSSTDGIHWTRETSSAPWTDLVNCVVFDNKLWVTDSAGNAWFSLNGINWNQAPKFPAGDLLVYNNKLWIIDQDEKLYYSTDGKTWVLYSASHDWDTPGHLFSIIFDNKLWIIKQPNLGTETWYLCIK